jgi:hypothetical protein
MGEKAAQRIKGALKRTKCAWLVGALLLGLPALYICTGNIAHWLCQPASSLSVFPLHREILTTVIAELRRSP